MFKQFHNAEAGFIFDGTITGDHYDKTWLEQSRACLSRAVAIDAEDMARFGPEPVYIRTLKKLLDMYDPDVAYNTSEGCSDEDNEYQVCANRRAFILFFHDQIKIDPRDPDAPKKIRVRNVPLNPRRLKSKLGRATSKENGLIDKQFRSWLSKDEYEAKIKPRDMFEKPYPKPDFFSPVPPYPRVEIDGWDAPLGYTSWGAGITPLEKDPDMEYTERAHLVESAAQKWIQYLVNYESVDRRKFFQVANGMDVVDVKARLAALHKANKDILFDANDKDPDYYIPDDFENMQQNDLYGIELYTLDSAANIVVINHRAHYMLFDNWLVDHGGTPNMSSGKPHDFFTLDTTGKVHGVVKLSSKDGREWIATRKGDSKTFRTGVGPNSRINPYWYEVSDALFERDRVQWLQNYRRKRWTQIRNIISAFMLEANINPVVDQNLPTNACIASKGCKYVATPASEATWTSHYDEEWEEYQTYLAEHALTDTLQKLSLGSQGESKRNADEEDTADWDYLTSKKNETIAKVSKVYNFKPADMVAVNKPFYPKLTSKSKLHVGTSLMFPLDEQTLFDIAKALFKTLTKKNAPRGATMAELRLELAKTKTTDLNTLLAIYNVVKGQRTTLKKYKHKRFLQQSLKQYVTSSEATKTPTR